MRGGDGGAAYTHPAWARQLLASLVPVVCPDGAERLGLTGAIVDHIEASMRSFPAPLRAALVTGLRAYDESARAWPRARGRRAARLEPAAAAALFERWWRSRLWPRRQLAVALARLFALAHYEMPLVKTALGYEPEAWIERVKAHRLAVYRDEIARHEASLIEADPLPSSLAARRAAAREAS